jgi:peptide/nickel transport system ATP-binding protein
MSNNPLLSVRGLKKHYPVTRGPLRREVGRVHAVDGVSLDLARGETLGLVGESGCGKSTAARTLLGLEAPTAGTVRFDGADIGEHDDRERKQFRRRASLVLQDPTSSFDPRMTMGAAVAEPLRIHGLRDAERRRAVVKDLLERVGLSAADYERYPHEFSGGQKQRVALARALSCDPDLLVADEPVSALDVSVQAALLSLLDDLQEEFDLSVLFISHDMSIVEQVADRVAVMYLGEIVEIGPTEAIFSNPQHPYTHALLTSIPTPDPRAQTDGDKLSGDVPSPRNPPAGCRFHTRCPEIIPPQEYAFEQDTWRSVMDLRVDLGRRRFDRDALRQRIAAVDADSAEVASDARLHRAIRKEYDLPTELSDSGAETVLSAAIDDLAANNIAAADERLREAFLTVCETYEPALQTTEAGHRAACHLHGVSNKTDIAEAPPSIED